MSELKFLIVEDDAYIALKLKKQILSLGYQVTQIAGNKKLATASFHANRPDIIIMDIGLTDGDEAGIELTNSFNKIEKLPIIYFTQYVNDDGKIEKAIQSNPYAILSKSAKKREIKRQIDLAIHQYFGSKVREESKNELEFDDDSIWIKMNGVYERIRFEDICWIETDDKIIKIITEKSTVPFSSTLKYFERKVPHFSFERLHNNVIINFKKAARLDLNERVMYVQHKDKLVPKNISEQYLPTVKERMLILKTRS